MRNSPEPAMGSFAKVVSSKAFLVMVLLLAMVLRVTHIFALRDLPLFDILIVDSAFYDKWAQSISTGGWMGGDRAFYMDPLYPYVMAAIYKIFGHDLLVVRLFQAVLGVATCGLVAVMGRRAGGRMVGNLAALLLAVYKPAIFQEGEIEKTALGVFLITAALTLAMNRSLKARLAAGICLGLAVLTRGNLLLLAPLGVLYFLFDPGTSETAGSAAPDRVGWWYRLRGEGGRSALVFLLGFFIVLTPVAWRNHHLSGEWILTTSQAGPNFYTGNNPANITGGFEYVPFVRPQPFFEESDFRAEAEARTGRILRPSEVSSYWFAEALKHIAANPGFAALVSLKKLVIFWSDFEMPDAWDMYFLARYSPVLGFPLPGMGLVLPLAALGAYAGFRGRPVRLLVGYIIAYALSVIAFFVFSRYRLHVVPALAVLAALAFPLLHDLVKARNLRRGFAYISVATLIALFSFVGVRSFGLGIKEYTQSFINLAYLYSDKGDFAKAEQLLKEALEKQHGFGQAAPLCALGELYLRTGNLVSAGEEFKRCVRINPLNPNAFMLLGVTFELNGQLAEAAEAYEQQIRIIPGHEDARQGLARLR